MTDEKTVRCTLKIAYKEKYLMKIRELNKIQQDIRGNVNNIIKKQTITNTCNAIHVSMRNNPCFLSVGYANKSVWWMPWH